jgi:hypothetical protein
MGFGAGRGGPAQPSSTIGQCLNGGLGWLELECHRYKTRAACHAGYADMEAGSSAEMPVMPKGPLRAAGAHDQAD